MEKKINTIKASGVEAIKNQLANSKDVFFTEYRGLSVPQLTELRRNLRKEEATLKISKNKLAKIAFSKAGKKAEDGFFKGPTAIIYAKGESGPVAKILVNFAKDNDKLVVKGGIVDNEIYDVTKVTAYGNLPTRLEMLAMVANTINGVASKLARTLQAVVDKKAEA